VQRAGGHRCCHRCQQCLGGGQQLLAFAGAFGRQ
jgi:hypothetical protein